MMRRRRTGPPGRGRPVVLALGALLGCLLAGTAQAASYYEKTRPYHFSSGGLTVGSSVDVATGALRLATNLGRIQGRLPIPCGWYYNAQDATSGPLGPGTSLAYDWFIEWDGGGAYQVVGPGNRRFTFKPNGVNGQWTDTRDPEMLGAVLNMPNPPVYGQELVLRFKNGTQFNFDGWGGRNLLRVMNPHGYGAWQISRNSSGFPTQILQDPAYPNRYVGFTYNASIKLATMTFHVDAGGAGSLNRTWTFAYDGSGRLSSVTAPDTTVTQYSWTTYTRDDGQVLPLLASITNPRGYVALANLFDSSGRVTRQTFADNAYQTFSYSAAIGSPGTTTLNDPRGNVSSWSYAWVSDPWYSAKFGYTVFSTTDALNRTTTYERNAAPTTLVTAVTDFRNRRVSMSWDTAKGNLLSTTHPTASGGTVTASATYEPNTSVCTSETDEGGRQTVYTVTGPYGEVVSVRDPRNNTTTLTYGSSSGDLLSTTNALNQTSSNTYGGPQGDLLTSTDPAGHVISRVYDAASRLVSVTDANNKTTSYTYDVMDQIRSISRVVNGQTLTTVFEYDSNGNRTALVDPKNQRWEWSFDSRDRCIQDKNPLLQTRSYSYDGNSNILARTDRLNQRWEYAYTTGDRLSSQTFKRADSTVEATVTSSYSPVTDLLSSVTDSQYGTTSWTYDSLDRTLTESGPSGTLSYTLDDLNRCTGLQVPGQAAIAYGFDPNDNLVSIA